MIAPAELREIDRALTLHYANLERQIITRHGVYHLLGIASRLHDEVARLHAKNHDDADGEKQLIEETKKVLSDVLFTMTCIDGDRDMLVGRGISMIAAFGGRLKERSKK